MRHSLSVFAATALMAVSAVAADKELTISVYSFSQDAYKEALYDPFAEICGCEIVTETGNSVERMAKIEAFAGDPVIDVAVISSHDALALAEKGLIASLDVSRLENHGKLYEAAQDPVGNHRGIGYTFYASSIVYRPDLVSIDSWADLFADDLKGRVALPTISGTQGPLTLLMLNKALGHDPDDFSETIDYIGERSDDVVTFYARSSQLIQLMNQDEVIAAPVGRFAWPGFKKSDLAYEWAEPREGQAGGMNVLVMTKGNGNEDLAYQFIDYWLSTEAQTRIAMALIDSPANKEVKLPADVADNLTYGAELINSLNIISPATIIANRDDWVEQWNQKVIK